ncbi:hypothetical protein O0L34_g16282 [Tuta absoluta]|nr:hypothetical protein O0L34_g16282 [Tuta absoluta]
MSAWWCQGEVCGERAGEVAAGERGRGATSGTSSGWGRGPRHTAGSALVATSANLTSRPRRNEAVRRTAGGLGRRAPAGCRLADDTCVSSRGGCTPVILRANGDERRN